MRVIRLLILSLCLCCSAPLYASAESDTVIQRRLLAGIDALLSGQRGAKNAADIVQTVTLLIPAAKLREICAAPVLSLPGGDARLSGRRSVVATCGQRRHFLPVKISASGRWWVMKNTLPAGSLIQAEDLDARSGSLEHLPAGLLLGAGEIIGHVTVRALAAGTPLVASQLRLPRRLQAGQQVAIVAEGQGFRIISQGTVLAHAAVNDRVKVRTRSGQILSGRVGSEGRVTVRMSE